MGHTISVACDWRVRAGLEAALALSKALILPVCEGKMLEAVLLSLAPAAGVGREEANLQTSL